MGRLSEALRRAGHRVEPESAATPEQEGFVSPWSVTDVDPTPVAPTSQPQASSPAPNTMGNANTMVNTVASAVERSVATTVASTVDRTVATPIDRASHTPVANTAHALLHRFKPEWKQRLTIGHDVDPLLVEQFRRLAASLVQAQRAEQIKSILVTSAVASEGKTLTALNIALVLSETYRRRVLLIDADLRRPAISEAINMKSVEGLAEAIQAPEDRKVALMQITETLTLLAAGKSQTDPLGGLTSGRMGRLIEEAESRYDWVIVDSPPVGAVADAGLLCPMVDAALVVVRSRNTPHAAIQRTIDALGRDRILGLVLNGADRESMTSDPKYGYSEYGYGDKQGDTHERR